MSFGSFTGDASGARRAQRSTSARDRHLQRHRVVAGRLAPDEQAIALPEPEREVWIALDQSHRLVARIDVENPQPAAIPFTWRRPQSAREENLVAVRSSWTPFVENVGTPLLVARSVAERDRFESVTLIEPSRPLIV